MSRFVHNEGIKYIIRKYPVSCSIILINTVFLLLTLIMGGFDAKTLYRMGALEAFSIASGEYYRLIIPMFLHGSFIHYAMNTFFGVAILGLALEKLIGSWRFALVYFISGLASNLLVFYVGYYHQMAFTLTIGASGAIFGILGFFFYILMFQKYLLSETDRKYLIGLIVLNAFTSFLPSVSLYGHLGGFIAGFLLSAIHYRFNLKKKRW